MPSPAIGSTLHIDWTACDGRGLCTELLSDILARDKWGFPIARTGAASARSDVAIPRQRLEAANEAVSLCPLLALRLIEPPS